MKDNAKDCSNYHATSPISHTSKLMLKLLQVRLQQYVNCELPDVQAGFRKGRGSRDQLPTSAGSSKKRESFRKTSISTLLNDYAKAFDCVDHNKLWKILKRDGNTRPPDLRLEESVRRLGNNS